MTAIEAPRNRGRRNSNERGGSKDRRARRAWLVTPEAGFGGDGTQVPCQAPVGGKHRRKPQVCGTMVTAATLFVGRIVPGHQGGTYRRDNIRPECPRCSCREGQGLTTELRKGGRNA